MATIKLKFRPSKVQGKAGKICYLVCPRTGQRQITRAMRKLPQCATETTRAL